MPTMEHYKGLTLVEALRQLADHHSKPRTRHITQDERKLIHDAADWMERNGCKYPVQP